MELKDKKLTRDERRAADLASLDALHSHEKLKKVQIDRPLTDQQANFVKNVVWNGMTQSAAARAAGYSETVAKNGIVSTLTGNPKIRAAIAKERELFAKANEMTRKKVVDGMKEAIDMARVKADPAVMVAGWREIGRICGFYEPVKHKVEVSVSGKVLVEKLQTMSDEELLRLAEESQDEALEGDFEVIEDGEQIDS
jgi:phage terminase small subunit